MPKLDAYFRAMHQQGASDLHLVAGNLPAMRIHGELRKLKAEPLTDEGLREFLRELPTPELWARYEQTGDADFGYELEGVARFRANYFVQKYGAAAVFRLIPSKVLSCEDLGLPEAVKRFAYLRKGLVLVTGPTGSGKSTTLAAVIDEANRNRRDNIITVEDPVEFVHESKGCLVSHREVGAHTKSFAAALRAALREDPDVILVGEMRDKETVALAIEAAATGHLVFGTLHTQNAPKTVDRVIEVFTAEEQPQIRSTLADSLKGVVAQNLFKRLDGKGRIAALEIMVVTPAISNLIREAKTYQIPSAIQTGKKHGMQSLDVAIAELLEKKIIDPKEAYEKAVEKERFLKYLPEPPPEVAP
ncbi:MAG: type IV pilus twitching motility protein PilT [Deltaproteobacteria bacterium]|nr:type IV pilus twitching motility protein PilT [Deltaproteobacteria bacterium]